MPLLAKQKLPRHIFLTHTVLRSEFVVVEHFVSPEYVILELLLNSPKLYLPTCGITVSVLTELMRNVYIYSEIREKRIHMIC